MHINHRWSRFATKISWYRN